jgi:hypothetical protein
MKNCARIANKEVCSDQPFIVYSHTFGMLAECPNCVEAKRCWEHLIAQCRERARDSDSVIFEWQEGHWAMCGSLDEAFEPSVTVPLGSF